MNKEFTIFTVLLVLWILCSPVSVGWEPLTELKAPDPCEDAYFGYSASIENGTAAMGALGRNSNQGAVYVYDINESNSWDYVTILLPPNLDDTDQFGYSVCIDANRIVVGVSAESANEVYVFDYNGTDWDTDPKILSVVNPNAYFGQSVSIDGNTIIVGAKGNTSQNGAAYVFDYNGVEWNYKQELADPCGAINDDFGCFVAVDGNVIVVGAESDDAPSNREGSICVFRYNGIIQAFEQKLEDPSANTLAHIGCSVSVSGDTIVAGAYQYSYESYTYVYRWNGSIWDQNTILLDPNPETNDKFGTAVVIDGNTIIVGNRYHDGSATNSGAAYLFEWDGDSWSEGQILEDPDGAASEYFGCSVAIDGDMTLVGAKWDDGAQNQSGAAFVFLFLVADLNQNGMVNFEDFAFLASQWFHEPGEPSADIAPDSGDNIVNMLDLLTLTNQWLEIGSAYVP